MRAVGGAVSFSAVEKLDLSFNRIVRAAFVLTNECALRELDLSGNELGLTTGHVHSACFRHVSTT